MPRKQTIKERLTEVLNNLSDKEQILFKEISNLERYHLNNKKPQITEEIRIKINEVIK